MISWIPRRVDPSSRDALVGGVPEYMRATFLAFLQDHLARYSQPTGRWYLNENVIAEFDLAARNQSPYVNRIGDYRWPGFIAELDGEELLDLADWIAHSSRSDARALDMLLEAGGSVWTIGERNGLPGLVRRMPESVQLATESVLDKGSAGALLREAWLAAYGRDPDPEEAYEKAIKAIEQATIPIVSPKNLKATLGTVIRDMRAQQGWSVDLPGEHRGVVVDLAEALWTGQESRHGGNDYRAPTQSEAETAVTFAVALLQLFASGSVGRR